MSFISVSQHLTVAAAVAKGYDIVMITFFQCRQFFNEPSHFLLAITVGCGKKSCESSVGYLNLCADDHGV